MSDTPRPTPTEVRHLWIQYAYDDIENAPIIQCADSEDEAREVNDDAMDGCVWYRCDIAPGPKGSLTNPDGPHYLATPPDQP